MDAAMIRLITCMQYSVTYFHFLNFILQTNNFNRISKSDYDEDCADGLVCWYDDGSGRVPGCTGTPRGGWEYCIEPIATDSIEADSDTANQSNYTGPSLTEADLIKKCEGDW